jgi:type IV pilus assembly protein PilE
MDRKGVTLIELTIVVAIIAILAAIAIPTYIGQQKKAARSEGFSNLESLALLEEQYYAENGRYAPDPDGSLTYAGTHGTADGGLEDVLKGFKPGTRASLSFDYAVRSLNNGAGFVAVAAGKTGSRVAGETYTINQNNEKNF